MGTTKLRIARSPLSGAVSLNVSADARGLFAGVSLNGAAIKQDKDSTREFYGRMVPFKTALTGKIDPPAGSNAFLTALAQWAQAAAK